MKNTKQLAFLRETVEIELLCTRLSLLSLGSVLNRSLRDLRVAFQRRPSKRFCPDHPTSTLFKRPNTVVLSLLGFLLDFHTHLLKWRGAFCRRVGRPSG